MRSLRSATLSENNPNQTLITLLTDNDSSQLEEKKEKKIAEGINLFFVNLKSLKKVSKSYDLMRFLL